MPRSDIALFTLNRGQVDRRGLARVDVKRLQLAAEEQTNWIPKVLGCMTLRPGWGYLGSTFGNVTSKFLKFIFATDDTALLELTDTRMRIWIDDELLTRPSVSTTITNDSFDTNLTGWTDLDAGAAASAWLAGGYMQLVGDGTSRAIREQQVSVALLDRNVEHGIRIVINRGPVSLRIGSTSGGDDLQGETTLQTGTHSISITPTTASFYIRFFSSQVPETLVDSCSIEASGAVILQTPWGPDDFDAIRYDQSADVIFVACAGFQQRRIERRGDRPGGRSWSVVLYRSSDGPFRLQNVSPVTMTPSAITGNITVTSSEAFFDSGHIGALFSLSSVGQTVTVDAAAADTWTPSVRVTGIDSAREVTFTVAGTFVATVNVQRSFDNATWSSIGRSFTAPATDVYNDGLDNSIAYYRIGIALGDYTSGTATCAASISSGTIRGIVRVTSYISTTQVRAEVLADLGGTDATDTWEEGQWSDVRGWPTAVQIHEGRMWWAGINGIWGSLSDAYDSFDQTFPGDAGAINRTIGSGPVDTVNWLLSLKGLVLGAQGAEHSVRASSLDEPLTPTNFNIKGTTTQGSGNCSAVKIDQNGYFVDRTGCKVFELSFDVRPYDFQATDLMLLCPEIGLPGIVRMDVQRKPDTRIHAVRSDGIVVVGVINRQEDVLAWIPIQTNGQVEDVVILPAAAGELDDQVYYVVRRGVNGATVRYLEKWAQELNCRGDALCYLADSYIAYSGPLRKIITGLDHLEGEQVVVWADSADVGTDDDQATWIRIYTVSGGQIILAEMATNVVVGLGYGARFKSSKLGMQTQAGSSLNQMKTISHVGMTLADTHRKGVRFGPSYEVFDDLPGMESGIAVTEETHTDYDEDPIEFPGEWTTNSRICITAQAPRPATVLSLTVSLVQT